MKFLTDEMEGNLTNWLRFLGYDTRYAKEYESMYGTPVADDDLIKQCFLEHRILITRDRDMIRRFEKRYRKLLDLNQDEYLKFDVSEDKSPCILLFTHDFAENMSEIYKKFKIRLSYDSNVARCSNCNSNIKEVKNKKKIKDKIPESVFQNINDYWICCNENCNKIYWIGGHFKDIFRKLSEIKREI